MKFFTYLTLLVFLLNSSACDGAKEYPWNPEWDQAQALALVQAQAPALVADLVLALAPVPA